MAYNNQEQPDYADSLEPGHRFCPTDLELIVYYLKRKIDTGIRHPNLRHYEVKLYDYGPDELTAKPEYRSCENKWYFLTPRERKHPNGNRPNRKTKNGGTWKASQKAKPLYDGMERVVGSKTCLAYLDENFNKTPWLMQEFTTDNPNIPRGSQEQKEDGNKLTEWVLCKIYKNKETKPANNNFGDQVEAIEEQNQQRQDEPSPIRRRLSWNHESSQLHGPEHVPVQETNYNSEPDVQMVEHMPFMLMSNQQSDLNIVDVGASQSFPTTSMNTSPNAVTDQVQQSVGTSTLVYYQNQSRQTSTNGFQFSCGASSSTSKMSLPAIVEPGNDDMAVPQEENIYDNLAPLDDLMTSPAQALADQMNSSPNPQTMQQMDFSPTIIDEEDIYANLSPLDDLMTSPSQALADQRDASPNPNTMHQMAFPQTIIDEVHQQPDQDSNDDAQIFFDELMIVHRNDYSYLEKLMAFDNKDAPGSHPKECHYFDCLDDTIIFE